MGMTTKQIAAGIELLLARTEEQAKISEARFDKLDNKLSKIHSDISQMGAVLNVISGNTASARNAEILRHGNEKTTEQRKNIVKSIAPWADEATVETYVYNLESNRQAIRYHSVGHSIEDELMRFKRILNSPAAISRLTGYDYDSIYSTTHSIILPKMRKQVLANRQCLAADGKITSPVSVAHLPISLLVTEYELYDVYKDCVMCDNDALLLFAADGGIQFLNNYVNKLADA